MLINTLGLLDTLFSPPTGIEAYEEENALVMRMILPGYEKGKISVVRHKDTIRIRAEPPEDNNEDREFYTSPLRIQPVDRTFALPRGELKDDAAEACYRNGILEIKMEKTKKKELEVKVK